MHPGGPRLCVVLKKHKNVLFLISNDFLNRVSLKKKHITNYSMCEQNQF